MRQLPEIFDPKVVVGIDTADDAAVYKLSGDVAVVQTVDYITPIVDEPFIFGEVAAANSISDVYAMGATPIFALSILGFPPEKVPLEMVEQILRGGISKAKEANIQIIGGHTVDDEEPKYGLVVTGVVAPDEVITNATAQVGDDLILTKPIGTGIVNTAIKVEMASEESMREAIKVMTTLNRTAAEVMVKVGVNACTDVTGFGLLGHIHEMTDASGVGANVYLSSVPVIAGIWELLSDWVVPEGTHSNVEYVKEWVEFDDALPDDAEFLLFDPQTSGGLLMSVPGEKTERLLESLTAAGVETFARIGDIIEDADNKIRVRI